MAILKMEVRGVKELERKLMTMPSIVAKKVVRKSVRKGAKIIHAETKSTALSMVGGEMGRKIASAIVIKTAPRAQQRPGSYSITTQVNPNKSDQFVDVSKSGVRNYIPAAIEYGHIKANGGHVPAIAFARTAFGNKERTARQVIEADICRGIEIEASKPA